MSEVKLLRLSTGEDIIAKVGENDQGVSLNKQNYFSIEGAVKGSISHGDLNY